MTTTTLTTTGSHQWQAPAGVTSVQVECWAGGGGGGGGDSAAPNGGGGGGGGEYAKQTVFVTPGNYYDYYIGTGGNGGDSSSPGITGGNGGNTYFTGDSSVTVTANGGHGGDGGDNYGFQGEGGVGGSGSTATVHHNGGSGGNGGATVYATGGGGGGGSGGTGSGGNGGYDASGGLGGAGASAVTGGGPGGDGADLSDVSGHSPSSGYGGGGGGGPRYRVGGDGYQGKIVLTYSSSQSATAYPDVVPGSSAVMSGAGGTGITHDHSTLGDLYSSTGVDQFSHSAGSNATTALVIILQDTNNSDQVSGVTYGGSAMTKIDSQNYSAGGESVVVSAYWLDGLQGLGLGGTRTVAVTTTGSAVKRPIVYTMVSDSGTASIAAYAYGSSVTDVTNPSWDITGLDSGSELQAYMALVDGAATITDSPSAGWASDGFYWNFQNNMGGAGTDTGGAARQHVASSGTSLTCGWTAGADTYMGIGVAFTATQSIVHIGASPAPSAITPSSSVPPPANQPASVNPDAVEVSASFVTPVLSGDVDAQTYPDCISPMYVSIPEAGIGGLPVTTGNSDANSGQAWDDVVVGSGAEAVFDLGRRANGNYSYRISTGSATTCYLEWNTFGSLAYASWQVCLYIPSLPASTTTYVSFLNASGLCAKLQITTDGYLRWADANGSTITTGSYAITAGAWFLLDGVVYGDSSDGGVLCRLHSGKSPVILETISGSGENIRGAVTKVRFGCPDSTANFSAWFDDLVITGNALTYEMTGGAVASGAADGPVGGDIRGLAVADSLILGGCIELLGGGVASELPECQGAIFKLQFGYDLGAPQPQSDVIGSLLLDGERPYGRRAGNRTIELPIVIMVPSTGNLNNDRSTLAGAREALLKVIDRQTWTLAWTREGGLPLLLDCFRAQPTEISYNALHEKRLVCQMKITFQALPYGHSDTETTLTFDAPAQGYTVPPSPVLVDDFSSVSGTGWEQSSEHVVGPYSVYWPMNWGATPTYTRSFSSQDITDRKAMSFWLGLGTHYYWKWHKGNVNFNISLYDGSGHTLKFGTSRHCYASNDWQHPHWTMITASIPDKSWFDYTDVVGYSITVWEYLNFIDQHPYMRCSVWIDCMKANPVTTAPPLWSNRGMVYNIWGIQGTSRAPLNLHLQHIVNGNLTAFNTLLVHRPGQDAPRSLTPFVVVGNGADVPNGSTQYDVDSPLEGVNARFNGTYTVVLTNYTWSSPSSSRTITATVREFEYSGGPSTSISISRTLTPSSEITNGIVVLGELTLPSRDIADDNSATYFTVSVTDTNTNDRFLDMLFLDTTGQTMLVNISGTGYKNYFVDEPNPDRDLGLVLGSSIDRAQAVSVLDKTFLSGGPLTVEPGDNALLVYSVTGAPNLAASYFPRWYLDRLY